MDRKRPYIALSTPPLQAEKPVWEKKSHPYTKTHCFSALPEFFEGKI
jgi:hypothetical protein